MFNSRRSFGRGPVNRGFRPAGSFQRKNRFAPKSMDSRLFIRTATPEIEAEVVINHTFADFNFHPQVHTNITGKGMIKPTPIQDQTLEHALLGKDIIGLADTGTGKTAAFALPIIQKLLANPQETCLIVAPTRELAVQIRDEIRALATNLPIYSCILIGGSDIRRQLDDLRRRPHIYIGTPGRLRDLYNRRALNLQNTRTVVLDEVDRMLDMGFVKEITELMSFLPREKQTLLFSATLDSKIEDIARRFLNNPLKISVKSGATSQNVDQDIIRTHGNKMEVLTDLLSKEEFSKVLVFGRTKHGVEKISISLQKAGFPADAIHGDKRQNQREAVLRKFRANQINILIATDVAARGIDVKDISHVINYDEPGSYDDYVHRIGRTGRAGKMGKAITFVE
ncbi:MAG: DEAD/DEAH box helicase domain protein [Candidatus Collierbacteria bacterium GW2011_GWB1_44_6]|uniref:DEAD/DEAH box helicase domain protein n=1 Tax=Candidatus Collierbacteria bacterium GW2011_GWB1_44_6 TaxID=1618384 RepID=A0A0G1MN75_9BACT|nr:MAG: DEAD/DEAH box helicase domain protein [Candidatus Moranbacteria bacterium GW2011_GWF2_44_10]KKT73474.1 MAG: DEAD/DEAH box helicase domain protein [Candidatus Collierbacteria bacterium GW2011_GWB1_44_6]KKT83854.1 MAG: DEAD/DEAH box helicase domain protein [Microgenomates group bacterium GW2011_GWC1_44_9]